MENTMNQLYEQLFNMQYINALQQRQHDMTELLHSACKDKAFFLNNKIIARFFICVTDCPVTIMWDKLYHFFHFVADYFQLAHLRFLLIAL